VDVVYQRQGYDEVVTPIVYDKSLWEQSGHWDHYSDDMFFVSGCGHTMDAGQHLESGLKPMNCPAHCLIFKHLTTSYRDLPVRLADFSALHRNEASGALSGLTRVRQFHQDDGHIFCTPEQIADEVGKCLEFVERTYGLFGFEYSLKLSTRPEKSMGSDEAWDNAEACLVAALDAFHKPWVVDPGDGAFYGPKIDITLTDALGRHHQTATIQLDFQLPERFELEIDGAGGSGDKSRPVIIHRAILGSVERFMAILCEHTAGHWPLWLSPRQVLVCPIGSDHADYADEVAAHLKEEGFFVDVDASSETLGKRLRQAQELRYNYVVVAGGKEVETSTISVRPRGESKPLNAVLPADFVDRLKQEVRDKA